MNCTCGVPNRANFHAEIIIGRYVSGGTETESVDTYVCDKHDPDDHLRFDDNDEWEVLAVTKTRLR